MVKEIWKDIVNYEGYYQISNLGNIRSLDRYVQRGDGKLFIKGKQLNFSHNNQSYKSVSLYKEGKYKNKLIHRLVAQAFIPNPENKSEVNHIDGDKSNNCVDNLEWVTASENVRHSYFTNLNRVDNTKMKRIAKISSKIRSIPVMCLEDGRKFISELEAANYYNITPCAVNDSIKDGKSHCGFTFKKIDTVKKLMQICDNPNQSRAVRKLSCPVKCIETGQIFQSRGQAARKLNIPESSVYDSLRDGRSHRGYTFVNVPICDNKLS